MARFAVFALVLFALSAIAAAQNPGDCFAVAVSALNVRDSSCDGNILGKASRGDVGVVSDYGYSDCGYTWVPVQIDGLSGYVAYDNGNTSPADCNSGSSSSSGGDSSSGGGGGQQVTNDAGIQLIENAEGWRSCWYRDVAGYPTIGYGHLIKTGEPYSPGTCISMDDGEALLRSDLAQAENCVRNSVQVPLNDNQFAALVSFTFNLGCGSLQSSTLLQVINSGNFSNDQVCSELSKWVKAGGRTQPGLVTRRQNECNLFSS